jgi:hypothetical protein
MRAILLGSVLALIMAAPVSGQTCAKTPLPFLPGMFPRSVAGMPVEFASAPGSSGCMAMYRPASQAERESEPWVVVSIDPEPSDTLGRSADEMRKEYKSSATRFITVDGWPVSMTQESVGDEFIAVKGSVRITVLVKNGDHGQKSQDMATSYLHLILAKVPCG